MDDQEILRRKQEAHVLRKQLGDFEYRKIKAARRKAYYEETQKMRESRAGITNADPHALVEYAQTRELQPPPQLLQRPKERGSYVQIMVVDPKGEYTHIWNAPQLTGTVPLSKQTKAGYMELIRPALEKAFGRLQDRER